MTETTHKRADYISWEEYFMAIAQLSAKRSKDPSTQVGACIVNSRKRIIGIGYNGFPIGCSDDELPWSRTGDFLDTKYPYVCHAEMNAITNTSNKDDLEGGTMYVSLFPCNECAKLCVQVGIREVVFLSDKYHDDPIFIAARRIFDLAGVKYRQLVPIHKDLSVRLE
jgi:dCMP deaminase